MYVENHEVNIWYLFHSGFAVKTSNHFLIFDYASDSPAEGLSCLESAVWNSPDIQETDTIVFSSHRHSDHFNPVIFDWKSKTGKIEYVLSYDIDAGRERKDVLMVHPGHKYDVKGVNIEVFDSTDIGVSFLVNCDGVVLFHAGDLNWWHWNGEPEDENNAMADGYKKQIDLLRGKQIDLAFIPLDPRLEENYVLGLDYFMKAVGAKMVFPMHFGNDYSVFQWLKKDRRAAEYVKGIVEIAPGSRHFVYK